MKSSFVLILAILALASVSTGAQGVERTCEVAREITGGGRATARVAVEDTSGRIIRQTTSWQPRGQQEFPMLSVNYASSADGLVGDLEGATVGAVVEPARMVAPEAEIIISPEGLEAVRRPWRMYAQMRAESQTPSPSGAAPVAFFGLVPFYPASTVASLGQARSADVLIRGSDGGEIARNRYDLTGRETARASINAALLEAMATARTNAASCPLAQAR